MKKQKKRKKINSAGRFGRLPLIFVVIATASVAIGAVTVVSRRLVGVEAPQNPVRNSTVTGKAGKGYVTVKVAGRDVQVDSQTGQIKPLTSQEAQQLAEGLRGMLNQSTEGLVQVRHADGSVSMDLDGRFQNVMVARINEDRSLSQSCIDSPQAAASFFGIDPQLLGVESSERQLINQPARLHPARNPIR
jgi:DNA-binding protein YbaB